MKSLNKTLIAFTLGTLGMSCITLSASETKKHQVMVKIEKNSDHEAFIDVKLDGVTETFAMPNLEPGESRTITTESGKTVTITKIDDVISLDIDGKQIKLPMFGGNLGAHIHSSLPLHHVTENSITISGVDLDENQKQIIRDAFVAAGIVDKEITFAKDNLTIFSTDEGILIEGEKEGNVTKRVFKIKEIQ